jgi:branched-chain amino acid transport system ATP-binding protein
MSDQLLEVRDLTVRYGGVSALAGVTFSVGAGEVVGLIGPNGAGKTTCIDALTGFTAASGGQVLLGGHSLDGVAPHARARRGFVRTFQSLELFDDLTVRENLVVSASTPTWWSTVTDALWPKRHLTEAIDETLAMVGLTDVAGRDPSELSNGQRHLVALGRALVSEPQVVLLDEPAAGLDPDETAALGALLRTLPGRGVSVLLVDHDMPLVMGTCDRVLVLDFGRLIASGTPGEVRADPAVVAAYLGASAGGPDPTPDAAGETAAVVRPLSRGAGSTT